MECARESHFKKLVRDHQAQQAFKTWLKSKNNQRRDAKLQNNSTEEKSSEPDRKACFQAWVDRKNSIENEIKREAKYTEKKNLEEKLSREAKSKEEYDRWRQVAKTKPKCVPMNKGLASKFW